MSEDQDRAEYILETALMLGERHGWDALHLHDVARQMEIGLAEIHRHYRQQDDLAEAWFDRADLALIRAALLWSPRAGGVGNVGIARCRVHPKDLRVSFEKH